jgi:hypothetical protein
VTAADARPESGELSAIEVTPEPMTSPNAVITRTLRRLIIITKGNCNGSVIWRDTGPSIAVTSRGRRTSQGGNETV